MQKNLHLLRPLRRRRNNARPCLMVMSHSGVTFVLLSLLSHQTNSIDYKIQVELDSHTDTSVVGSNVLVVHDHAHYVDVYGYDCKSRHKNVTTVNAAVAYNNSQIGNTSVLLINQAILIPSIKNILLCPMQCHLNGVSIDDVPKFLVKNPTVNDHVVIIPSDIDDSPLLISLTLQGINVTSL